MSDIVSWILVIGGAFALRAFVCTVVFFNILPEGDHCPNCDAVTLRIQSRGWGLLLPRFRPSWCYECGWHGLLRRGPLTPAEQPQALSKG
jgi:hypothetical protein